MVAVEVADEDIKNAVVLDFVMYQLALGAFAAIDQVRDVANGKNLGSMKTVRGRYSGRTA